MVPIACHPNRASLGNGTWNQQQPWTLPVHFANLSCFRPRSEDIDWRQLYSLTVKPPGFESPFEMQDLIVKNDAGEFAVIGRNDNLIILANGEKFSPHILEATLTSSPMIKEAIAFGQGQVEVGVLIQTVHDVVHGREDEFLEHFWPIISEANLSSDKYAQIASNDSIILIPHDAELPRSAKCEILRKETYQIFQDDIEAFYLGEQSANTSKEFSNSNPEENILNLVRERLGEKGTDAELNPDNDVFSLGLDSLQTLHLRRHITASYRAPDGHKFSNEELPRDFIYQYPSARKRADALRKSKFSQAAAGQSSLEELLNRYRVSPGGSPPPRTSVVLVTGASGGIESNIVAHLAHLENVAAVVSLNRQVDGEPKPKISMTAAGIDLDKEAEKKIVVMTGNTTVLDLGLSREQIRFIRVNVTHVIHAAWPMDFNRALASFEDAFQSLTNLIKLAQQIHQ
ncbi:NRPS-like enzyme [Lecanosticta acicola]|uniref:NRPS-like enzyme n=1 Tax=Lecanosticta acicola TaxID=111012 RepID=A0AAI9EC83_9PEZI|nr:NRPS-like enzyme [Lecanosticta acicola]